MTVEKIKELYTKISEMDNWQLEALWDVLVDEKIDQLKNVFSDTCINPFDEFINEIKGGNE